MFSLEPDIALEVISNKNSLSLPTNIMLSFFPAIGTVVHLLKLSFCPTAYENLPNNIHDQMILKNIYKLVSI